MRNRRLIVAAVAMIAVLLTGCSGIPRDGGVQAGQAVIPDDNPAPVFLPSGPQKDASMESTLRGFIDAASSPENNYAIAREYLTPSFGDTWKADAGVTVDDGTGRTVTVVDAKTMEFSVNPVAEVDASGEYRETDSTIPVQVRYQFAQVGGQWRLSQAPNGTVIDENTFSEVFSAQALYFFDPGFHYLVPDLRWFPRGKSAPTKIVRAVLAGPSPWLAGAVATAFPEGTKLNADAVQVVGREATVDLNSEALNADRGALQRMRAQLSNSLPSGLGVTITIDQNSQDIADMGAAAPSVNPRVDARALVLRGGEFGLLAASGQTLTPIDGISDVIASLNPSAVTLSAGQDMAAALTAEGVYAVRAGDTARLLDPRAGLVAPSVDNDGYVWSVPADRPTELVAYSPSGDAIAVPTPWPEASSIRAVKVSRDGTRLIALLGTGTDTRFEAAAIIREGSVPTTLGGPSLLAAPPGVPLDATWIDELTVASLSRLPGGEVRILSQQIGGVSGPLDSPPDSVAIAGGNSLRDLRALTGHGALEVQRGVGWQQRIDGISVLATQQGLGE